MKNFKLLALLVLALSLVIGSFTSCEYLEDLGITLPGNSADQNGDDSGDVKECTHENTKIIGAKAATCTAVGYSGDTHCAKCGALLERGSKLSTVAHSFVNGECSVCGEEDNTPDDSGNNGGNNGGNDGEDNTDELERVKNEWKASYDCITIEEALALCENFVDAPSTDRYYIIATIKSVDSGTYGQLTIEDETGEIMVYGTYSADGSTRYDAMNDKPVAGDLILIHGTLQNYKGNTKEVQNARLIDCYAGNVVPPSIDFKPGDTITVADALAIAGLTGENDRFYIRATVKSVTNAAYGEMIIEDATGEISVYNSKNADGSLGYAEMTEKPYKGDSVLLYCTLQDYNGTKEVKSAYIVEFEHVDTPFDESLYTDMTIAQARDAATGTLVKVSGVVARITYANGMIPSGVIIVDGTSSIYLYDGDIAARAKIGNTVSVAAEKTYWILGTESANAEKFGYKGANQLDNAVLISLDETVSDYDKSWITEATVKEIMDTPVTEDITNKIFKVNSLVKKSVGNGFTNYYFDDIDGVTGTYTYTQCNGSDFSWIDQYDGKICTVYLVAINAKSSTSGCVWRFLPIEIIDEGYTFDVNKAPEYAVIYHGLGQFQSSYTGDPAIELLTSVSSELLSFEDAILSYSSSNESVVYFTNVDGVVTLHCSDAGVATVTVTATHGGNDYSATVDVTVSVNADIEYISVADAITTPYDTDVVVKGIVGPSLVNQQGFYLFGEDGSMIAVKLSDANAFAEIAIGHEIVISGMRERYIKDDTYTTYGQDAIVNAVILANYYGSHSYSEAKIITDKTLADIAALDVTESHSTELYRLTVTIKVVEATYSSTIYVVDGDTELLLYSSSSNQYSWLKAYTGQTVTVDIAPCNWNEKTSYRGCVLAVVNEDGSKVYNTLNFN